jgi:hypothetical protein
MGFLAVFSVQKIDKNLQNAEETLDQEPQDGSRLVCSGMVEGSQITPPLPPPKGRLTTAADP